MSLEYIRDTYDVPAKRGGRVVYTGGGAEERGTITGSDGARLRVRLDGEKRSRIFHPTWEMGYVEELKP